MGEKRKRIRKKKADSIVYSGLCYIIILYIPPFPALALPDPLLSVGIAQDDGNFCVQCQFLVRLVFHKTIVDQSVISMLYLCKV